MGGSLTKLIKSTRLYIDEVAPDRQWTDEDNQFGVGLITLIGREIQSLERVLRRLNQNFFGTSFTFDSKQNNSLYALPTNFVKISLLERLKDPEGIPTDPVTLKPAQSLEQKNRVKGNTPQFYIIWGNQIVIFPPTKNVYTNYFRMWYIRQTKLPVRKDIDSSELMDSLDDLIALGAAIRALLQTQEPIEDLKRMRDEQLAEVILDLKNRTVQEMLQNASSEMSVGRQG